MGNIIVMIVVVMLITAVLASCTASRETVTDSAVAETTKTAKVIYGNNWSFKLAE